MNLLTNPWIPVLLADGQRVKLRLQDLPTSGALEIAHPRTDFSALALELVIDIVQTITAPSDSQLEGWLEGDVPDLTAAIAAWAPAFELFGDKAFMQLQADNPERFHAGSLAYEAPGEQTMKYRKALFVKEADSRMVCADCAPVALYLNQAHARASGKGYLTGPRTGNALSALVQGQSLWDTICLNLLPNTWFDAHFGTSGEIPGPHLLPWMNSEGLLHTEAARSLADFGRHGVLWWSPRAIQLFPEQNLAQRPCDICGEVHPVLIPEITRSAIKSRLPEGVRHPRTAWVVKPGKEGGPLEVPLTGFTAEAWLSMLLCEKLEYALPAYERLTGTMREQVQLRCFGYAMDNASPCVWMDTTTPIVLPDSVEHRALMRETLVPLVAIVKDMAVALDRALFTPKANKANRTNPIFPFVVSRGLAVQTLWQQMQPTLLESLRGHTPLTEELKAQVTQECQVRVLRLYDTATAPLMNEPRFARLLINRKTKLLRTFSPKKPQKKSA